MRPIDETYQEVELLVYRIVHNHIKRFGGEFDELIGPANEAFMDAYATYNPSRGAFTTLLYHSVANRLKDVHGLNHRRQTVSLNTDDTSLDPVAPAVQEGFNFLEFAKQFSEDAATVLRLVMETPAELASVVSSKGGSTRNWKSSLKEYLRKSMGWQHNRISEAFEEIGTGLSFVS